MRPGALSYGHLALLIGCALLLTGAVAVGTGGSDPDRSMNGVDSPCVPIEWVNGATVAR